MQDIYPYLKHKGEMKTIIKMKIRVNANISQLIVLWKNKYFSIAKLFYFI